MSQEEKSLKELFPNYPKVTPEEIRAVQAGIESGIEGYSRKLNDLFGEVAARTKRYERTGLDADRPTTDDPALAVGSSLAQHVLRLAQYQAWQDVLVKTLTEKVVAQETTIEALEKRLKALEDAQPKKLKSVRRSGPNAPK